MHSVAAAVVGVLVVAEVYLQDLPRGRGRRRAPYPLRPGVVLVVLHMVKELGDLIHGKVSIHYDS